MSCRKEEEEDGGGEEEENKTTSNAMNDAKNAQKADLFSRRKKNPKMIRHRKEINVTFKIAIFK